MTVLARLHADAVLAGVGHVGLPPPSKLHRGAGRRAFQRTGRRGRAAAVLAAAALHGALFALLASRQPDGPPLRRPDVMVVQIVAPPPSRRPADRPATDAGGQVRRQGAVSSAAPAGNSRVTAPGTGAPGPVHIEERWWVSEVAQAEERTRSALRRAQPHRLCLGLMDGVLTSEEQDFCDRYMSRRRPR